MPASCPLSGHRRMTSRKSAHIDPKTFIQRGVRLSYALGCVVAYTPKSDPHTEVYVPENGATGMWGVSVDRRPLDESLV
jgi:hypothetical protein